MNPQRRLQLAILLTLAGALLSALLLLQHHGETGAVAAVQQLCGEGQESGCDRVNQSRWSELLGVPLAGLGLVFYLSLAALLALALPAAEDLKAAAARLVVLGVAAALAADVLLLGVQAFSIGAFCKLCLATYAVNAALLALLWPQRRAGAEALGRGDGRLLALGWLLASLACVSSVWAADGWLRTRAAHRAASVLGAPTAPAAQPAAAPSVAPSAPAPGDGSPQALQAEIQRLQQTLDDPQKLQQYLTAKSLREFESATVEKLDLKVPVKGPADAPIKVVEFSDMMCPFCRQIGLAFKEYVPSTQGRVSVYFKNYPLDQSCNPNMNRTVHPGACALALAGICAHQQGRFWDYHDRVFAQQIDKADSAEARRYAAEIGLDMQRLDSCLASDEARQTLSAQIAEAHRIGTNATPTVLINGRKVPNLNLFTQMVEKESARLGLPPQSPPPPAAH
jgi:serine/threonine-protein kinase